MRLRGSDALLSRSGKEPREMGGKTGPLVFLDEQGTINDVSMPFSLEVTCNM